MSLNGCFATCGVHPPSFLKSPLVLKSILPQWFMEIKFEDLIWSCPLAIPSKYVD